MGVRIRVLNQCGGPVGMDHGLGWEGVDQQSWIGRGGSAELDRKEWIRRVGSEGVDQESWIGRGELGGELMFGLEEINQEV